MEEEKDLEVQNKEEESAKVEEKERGISGVCVEVEEEKLDVANLIEEIENLKRKCEEYKENWIRTSADFDNYRKRIQKEREEYIEYGNENILRDLLGIVDNLERALNYIKSQSSNDYQSLLNGVELIHKGMLSLLEKYGVRPINAVGQKFDPFYHEVVEQVEVEEGENGIILREYQKGYMYKSRVLRPSLVAVAKLKEREEGEVEEKGDKED